MNRIFPNSSMVQSLSDDSFPDWLLNTAEYGVNSLIPEDENTEREESHAIGEETAYSLSSVHALIRWCIFPVDSVT